MLKSSIGCTLNYSFFSVLAPVESYTVFQIVLQLYNEPFPPALGVQNSILRRNMTDQMLHLVKI